MAGYIKYLITERNMYVSKEVVCQWPHFGINFPKKKAFYQYQKETISKPPPEYVHIPCC